MVGAGLFLSRILLGALGNDENFDQLAVYFGLHAISAFKLTMLSFANSVTSIAAILTLIGIYYGSVYSLLSSLTIVLVGLQRLVFAFGMEMISAGSGYLVAPLLAGFLLFLSAIAVLLMTCGQKPQLLTVLHPLRKIVPSFEE